MANWPRFKPTGSRHFFVAGKPSGLAKTSAATGGRHSPFTRHTCTTYFLGGGLTGAGNSDFRLRPSTAHKTLASWECSSQIMRERMRKLRCVSHGPHVPSIMWFIQDSKLVTERWSGCGALDWLTTLSMRFRSIRYVASLRLPCPTNIVAPRLPRQQRRADRSFLLILCSASSQRSSQRGISLSSESFC